MFRPISVVFLLLPFFLSALQAQRYPFWRYSTSDGMSQNDVTALARDHRGFLWIGTNGGGLNRFDGRQFALFSRRSAGIPDTVTALAADGTRHLFVGTRQGLRCLSLSAHADDLQEHAFDRLFARIGGPVRRLTVRRNGVVYVETDTSAWLLEPARGALRPTDRESDRFLSIRRAAAGETVHDAVRDAGGQWWAATDRGVLRIDRTRTVRFHRANGLEADRVNALLLDNEGAIWCGSSNGLFRHVPGRAIEYSPGFGLPAGTHGIRRISEDEDGVIWLATGSEIIRLEPSPGASPATVLTVNGAELNDFIVRGDEQLVLAGSKGLVFRQGERTRALTARNGLPGDIVESVIPSRRGGYWVGTLNGLALVLSDSITVWTARDGLPSNRVSRIAEDAYGNLWIGTNAGACMLSLTPRDRVYPVPEMDGIPVASVFVDARNYAWFGTIGSGAYCFLEGRLIHLTKDDGLAGNTVYFIAQDKYGSMYFGTNGGVTVLPENNRQYFIPYDTASFQWRPAPVLTTYLRMTGMYTIAPADPSGGSSMEDGTVLVDSRGDLWFGSGDRLLRWRPIPPANPSGNRTAGTRAPSPLPEILLTRLRIDERELSAQSRITLAPNEEALHAWCSLPSFRSRRGAIFLYRLEHHESAWHVSRDGSVLYTGLEPGEYVLLVTATSGEGIWTPASRLLWIVKRAPFHETIWFWMIITAIAGGAGVAIHRQRAKRRKAALPAPGEGREEASAV